MERAAISELEKLRLELRQARNRGKAKNLIEHAQIFPQSEVQTISMTSIPSNRYLLVFFSMSTATEKGYHSSHCYLVSISGKVGVVRVRKGGERRLVDGGR